MDRDEYTRRYRAAQVAVGHDLWNETRDNGTLFGRATEAMMLLVDGEEVAYYEARGLAEAGRPLLVRAFTPTRRIVIQTTYVGAQENNPLEATARSRRGLQSVRVEGIGGGSSEGWPAGVALELDYKGDAEPTVLGSRDGIESDYAASSRLAQFYPSLLADLDT